MRRKMTEDEKEARRLALTIGKAEWWNTDKVAARLYRILKRHRERVADLIDDGRYMHERTIEDRKTIEALNLRVLRYMYRSAASDQLIDALRGIMDHLQSHPFLTDQEVLFAARLDAAAAAIHRATNLHKGSMVTEEMCPPIRVPV